jgi:hypothetical protein
MPAFGDEEADDVTGSLANANFRTNGIFAAEKFLAHRVANHAHSRARAEVGVSEKASFREIPLVDLKIDRRGASDGGGAGVLKIDRAERSGTHRRDGGDAGDLLSNNRRILLREVRHTGRGSPRTKPRTRSQGEQVVAEAGDLRFHRERGALAERDHGDDGRHADEDAEHG